MTAEPMAKPLVMALVVLPTASRLTMIRSGSPWNSPLISAMPAALSEIGSEGVLGHDDAGRRTAGRGRSATRGTARAGCCRCPRAMATTMARTMAMMAGTRRLQAAADAGQDGGGRAGAGRLGDVAHRGGLGRGVVLGDPAGHLAEHHAGDAPPRTP